MRSLTRRSLFKKNPFKKAFAATVLSAALMTGAWANPSGPQVRHGQVNISGLGGAQLNIEQLTNKAIVNWDSFSIGSQEAVRFLQPSQMAVILNRVTGQDPSQILGSLRANGQVFLINPNGILFGPGATVDVGGLVASTLGLTDQDFLNGNYNFTQDTRKDLASIINQGTIRISDGGYAVLTAPLVSNEGLIVANLGKVVIAGGEKTTLNFDGRDLINFEVGALPGDAGTVVLPKEAVGGILADMLGAEDRAGQLIKREDGTLALEGGSGTVYQAGTIRADGATGESAGAVMIDSARLTVLGENSVTAADGIGENSSGGDVYALSDLKSGTTVGYTGSQLSAQGGDSGDGGFIEFSGGFFSLGSSIDTTAEAGALGQFLLDPRDIFVVDGAAGANPLPGPAAPADLTINDATIEALLAGAQVTLQADRHVDFDNAVVINENTGRLKVIADADNDNTGDVFFRGSSLTLDVLDVEATIVRLDTSVINANTAVLVGSDEINQAGAGSTLNATNLGMQSSRTVGSSASDEIFFDAVNVALGTAGAFPSVIVQDTANGVNLVNSVTGIDQTVTTGGNPFEFSLTATGGDTASVTYSASPGAMEVGILRADNNVVLETSINAFGFLVIADADGNGTGGISQTAGQIISNELGLSAGNDGIGTAGVGANAIQVRSDELTLVTTGDANVVDTAGGVVLVDSVTVFGEVLNRATVTGISTGGSMQVTAQGGDGADLIVDGLIDAVGTNLDLAADNDVIFSAGQTAAVSNNTVLRADLDNNNNGTITFTDGSANAHILGPNLGLALSEDFGVAGTPQVVNFTNFIVDTDPNGDGTGGQVFIRDTTGDTTIGPVVGTNQSVSNLRAAGDVNVENTAGTLNINAPTSSANGDVRVSAAAGSVNISQNISSAAGQDVLIRAAAAGTIAQTGGTITGANIGLIASNVGSGANPVDIDGDTLVTSGTGAIFVNDSDDLALANSVTAAGDTANIGNTGGGTELRIQTVNGLTVGNAVQADDVSLVSTTGAVTLNQTVTGTNNVVVSAGGDLTGDSLVTGPNIGLDGANVGTLANPIMLDANNLAIDSEGNAYVQETDAVTLVGSVTSTSVNPGVGGGVGDRVAGNDAFGDFRVAAGGDIVADSVVTGGDITLLTTMGNVAVNQNIGDVGTVNTVLSATGNVSGAGTVTSQNLGLNGTNVGTNGANPLNIAANQVSIVATDSAFVSDPNDLTLVNNVTATAANDSVTGNTARQVFNVVSGNNLVVADDVIATGGAGIVELVAANNVNFTNNAGDFADATAGGDDGTIVIVATNGNITQEQGGLMSARRVGLQAGTDIGTTGGGTDNNAVDISSEFLSVVAERHANVLDTAGNLATTANVTGVNRTVTGVRTGGNLELETVGALDHFSGNMMVGGNADLVANNRITLGTPVNVTGSVVLTSNTDDILASPGAGLIITATSIGFNARNVGEDIGAISPLQFAADSISYNSTGRVFVRDATGNLEIIASVTGVDEVANGATSSNQTSVEALGGNLTVSTAVLNNNAGVTGTDLTAQANVTLNGNVTNANGNIVVTADSDGDNAGAISQGAGQSIVAVGVGLTAGAGGIGTAGADADAVDINATNLALETTGNANVRDTAGGVNIENNVTGFNRGVTGTAIGGSLEVEANGGDGANLVVNDDITVGTNSDLVADDSVTLNNAVNVTGNLVVRADNDGNNNGNIVGIANASAVGLGLAAAGNIDDGAGGPVMISVDTLAVDAGGNVNVQDTTGTLTVGSVTGVSETVNGASAGTDLSLNAQGTDLIVNGPVTAGRNIDLLANRNINLNDNVNSTGVGTVVIAADADGVGGTGTITQTDGRTVTGNRVGLSAQDGIGAAGAAAIDLNANEVAIETVTGSAFVNNTGALTIVDMAAGQGFTVTGNRAQTDFRIGAGGQITVDDAVVAEDIALVTSNGGMIINQNVGEFGRGRTNNVVLSGPGDITGDGIVQANNVGLDGANIGAAGNPFDVQADNLAIDSTGNSYVDAALNVALSNTVMSTAANDTVTGNTATGDYRVSAGATLTVNDQVNGNDVSLVTTNGGITLNQTVQGTQDVVLLAGGAGNSITQVGGSVVGQNVGLQAVNQISSVNPGEELVVTADNLVVNATTVLVADSGGGVNLGSPVTSTAAGDSVNANTAGNMRVIATGGSLTVTGNTNVVNDVQLLADNDVNLNAAVNAATAVVVADNDGDNTGAISQNEGNVLFAASVGLSAGDGGIGTPGADVGAVDINATNLALETSGNANVRDTAGGVTVVAQVTAGGMVLPNEQVTGNVVGGSLEIEANGGDTADLNIMSAIQVGINSDLVADDDILVNANVTVTNNLVLRADNDLNDNGGITGPGLSLATNLGLHSADNIGDPAGAPLEVDVGVGTLAVDTDGNNNQIGGGVNVIDRNGNLTLGPVTGVDETVGVVRSATTLRVETTTGDLNVNADTASGQQTELVSSADLNVNATMTSVNGDVDLQAGRDITLQGDIQATNGNVAVSAGRDIVSPAAAVTRGTLAQVNAPSITATQIGLNAAGDTGSIANPIFVNGQDLTYNVGNNLVVEDTAGGVRLVNQVVAGGTTINGINAGNDSRVVSNGGDLVVDAQVTVGRDGELVTRTGGDVVINQDYNAANGNVVVRSAGNISGNGLITAQGLGLDAPNGTAGTNANPLRIAADTLTVASRPFTVQPQRVFQRIPQVTAIVETVADVAIPPVVVGQTSNVSLIDGNAFAQDSVSLVESVLEEALDNHDLIYNETGWHAIDDDDDEYGTK